MSLNKGGRFSISQNNAQSYGCVMCSCAEISGDVRKWYQSGEVWQENKRNADIKIVFQNDGSVA